MELEGSNPGGFGEAAASPEGAPAVDAELIETPHGSYSYSHTSVEKIRELSEGIGGFTVPQQDHLKTSQLSFAAGISQRQRYITSLEESLTMFPDEGLPQIVSDATKRAYYASREAEQQLLQLDVKAKDLDNRVEIISEAYERIYKSMGEFNEVFAEKAARMKTVKGTLLIKRAYLQSIKAERAKVQQLCASSSERLKSASNNLKKKKSYLAELNKEAANGMEALVQHSRNEGAKHQLAATISKLAENDEEYEAQLQLKVEKQALIVKQKQRKLEALKAESDANRVELLSVFEELKRLHEEKHTHLQEWEREMRGLRRLDKMVMEKGKQFSQRCAELKVKNQQLANLKQSLVTLMKNTRSMRIEVASEQRKHSRQQELYQACEQKRKQQFEKVAVLHCSISTLEHSKACSVQEEAKLLAILEQRKQSLKSLHSRLEVSTLRLADEGGVLSESNNLVEECQRIQQQLEEKSRYYEFEEKQLNALIAKERTSMRTQQNEELDLKGEIRSIESTIKSFTERGKKLEEEEEKQLELLYAVDLKFHLQQKQLLRLEGKSSIEEKKFWSKNLESIKARYSKEAQVHVILCNEISKCSKELRLIARSLDVNRQEYARSSTEVEELHKVLGNLRKIIKAKEVEKTEKLILENDIKIESKRVSEMLNEEIQSYFALRNVKEQMLLSLREMNEQASQQLRNLKADVILEESQRRATALVLSTESHKKKVLEVKQEVVKQKFGNADVNAIKKEKKEIEMHLSEVEVDQSKVEEELKQKYQVLEDLGETHLYFKRCNQHMKNAEKTRVDNKLKGTAKKSKLEKRLFLCNNELSKRRLELNNLKYKMKSDGQQLNEVQTQMMLLQQEYEMRSYECDKNTKEIELRRQRINRGLLRLSKAKQKAEKAAAYAPSMNGKLDALKQEILYQSVKLQKPLILRRLIFAFEGMNEIQDKLLQRLTSSGVPLPSKPPSVATCDALSERDRERFGYFSKQSSKPTNHSLPYNTAVRRANSSVFLPKRRREVLSHNIKVSHFSFSTDSKNKV